MRRRDDLVRPGIPGLRGTAEGQFEQGPAAPVPRCFNPILKKLGGRVVRGVLTSELRADLNGEPQHSSSVGDR